MDRIADILVIVNPLVRDQPAVAKAAALARWYGAGIELLICDTKSSREAHLEGTLPDVSNARLTDNVESVLEQMAEPLRDDGLEVSTHVISGDPLHDTVLTWMRNSPADLLVKDTHHHSLAKRTLSTNTDWHLMQKCLIPLLLTKPTIWGTPPVVMAAVDPGHANDPDAALDHEILDAATSLAKPIDAPVHVVHAFLPATIMPAAVVSMPAVFGVSAQVLAAEGVLRLAQVKRLTQAHGIAEARVHVAAAAAAEYLPRMAAECHADIAVMGVLSRSALTRALIGSTAERMLERLPCDVLLVKRHDFAQNLPF